MSCYNCGSEDAVNISIGNTLYGCCSDKSCKSLLHEKVDEEITEKLKQKHERERMKRLRLVMED